MTWIKSDDGRTSTHWERKKLPEWEAALMSRLGVTVMQRDYHVRRGCECDWCVSRREVRRVNREYRNGPRANLTPEEAVPAIARLHAAHAAGLTCRQLSEHLNLSYSYVSHLVNGANKAMSRYVFARIMGAVWPEPERAAGRCRGGTRVNSAGTLRRLVALNSVGFSYRWMSKRVGIADSQLANYVRGERAVNSISRDTAEDIKALYDKYRDQDPATLGMHAQQISSLIRKHQRLRSPGPMCWDDDTIDDPDAIPQWTGKCGTYAGYHQHQNHDIPPCEPCIRAAYEYRAEKDRRRHAR